MSDDFPFEPPQSHLSDPPEQAAGSVGLGILFAVLIFFVGGPFCTLLLWAAPPLMPLAVLGPLGGVIGLALACRRSLPRTAKGLWIGLAIVLGLVLLCFVGLLVLCSGMKL